ncbi:MAG: GC-type dockerin domain-anchored protein, partial [Planctomycetota bacterium]
TNPTDVHRERGLDCIDCHGKSEIMGDGNIYGHMDQATKIDCRTCHGTPDASPTLIDDDGIALPNVAKDDGGQVILTTKVSEVEHLVPLALDVVSSNPDAACAMNGNHLKPEGGLECYSCHSAWVPNCFGCHFERNEQEVGLNLMTGEYEVGKVRTNNKIFETLRPFAMGPNSDGRIAPYIVGCQPIADVTAPSGEKILDFAMPVTSNGLSGLALNPVNPHTVRGVGEVRTCAECHRAPPSLGMGSGHYAIARDRLFTAGPSGITTYDRTDPGQPAPAGTLPFDGPAHAIAVQPNVVEGTADFLYVARGLAGVDIFDRRPGASDEPIGYIGGVDAIDVCRMGTSICVVDRGFGLRIYENEEPSVANRVCTLPLPGAIRAVPWGIHLLVAAGKEGLKIVNVADEAAPFVEGVVGEIEAVDVEPYAHYQGGSSFAVRAYVADPGFGVQIVDLLPDYDSPTLRKGLPVEGARGLDGYTRYVSAKDGEPSREHDYLYVAAGAAGLHVYDITDPDAVEQVASVTDLGGVVADVDVSSQLAPPGVDDYAVLANETLGLQVVDVNDPHRPRTLRTVAGPVGASRVHVEVQQMDRFLDEHGHPLKENSHPFTGIFSREDIVRILSSSIDCEEQCPADVDGSGQVDVDDLIAILLAWGSANPAADLDGDGLVNVQDLVQAIAAWGSCS